MSDQQKNRRPVPLSYDSELARRAEAPRYRAERIASAVAYHAGPEIGVTAVVGGSGAILVHPTALPIVAVLTTLWAAVDRLARRRKEGEPQTRPAARVENTQAEATESAEGIA